MVWKRFQARKDVAGENKAQFGGGGLKEKPPIPYWLLPDPPLQGEENPPAKRGGRVSQAKRLERGLSGKKMHMTSTLKPTPLSLGQKKEPHFGR